VLAEVVVTGDVDVGAADLVGAAFVLGAALVAVGVRALSVGTPVRAAAVLRGECAAAGLGAITAAGLGAVAAAGLGAVADPSTAAAAVLARFPLVVGAGFGTALERTGGE